MMNKLSKLLILLVVIAMLAGCFASCQGSDEPDETPGGEVGGETPGGDTEGGEQGGNTEGGNQGGNTEGGNQGGNTEGGNQGGNTDEKPEFIDYASQVKFDPNSGRAWAKVKVYAYIDGDTTHFETTDGTVIGTLDHIKARYLCINTPESTGVIEPWGKKASNYTKTQLLSATDIIIESNDDKWNLDSTGSRYLLWIWYKTADDTEYRNLNLEILQAGLAFGSNVSETVYGDIGLLALNQAKTMKLHVFDKATKDPDYYYGGAVEVTLEELKANTYWDPTANNGQGRYMNKYEDMLVKFEAVVAYKSGVTIYVEEYDPNHDMYFGMQIFAGYNYNRMSDFEVGNRVVIVGTLNYYENGRTYQICNLKCKLLNPTWEGGCRVLSTGHTASYREVDANTILNGSIELDTIKEVKDENGEVIDEILVKETFDYGALAHYSTVTVKNLTVQSVWTTNNGGDSDGALTITCKDERGVTIQVRTDDMLLRDVDGVTQIVTADEFPKGTVISVKGIIDSYNGQYQIKVFSINDITFE